MNLFDVLNEPPTLYDRLNWRNDCSVWQAAVRAVRGPFRRALYPNGPDWFSGRIPSTGLIKALYKCSDAEAAEMQADLDASRLRTWLAGF